MFDQMLAIENANLKARVETIAKLPDDVARPTIVYLGTAEPGYDPIVDDKQSSDNIQIYAQKAGVPFLSYEVPGAIHSRPDVNEGYIKTLAGAKVDILSSIDAAASEASLHRVTSMTPAVQSPK